MILDGLFIMSQSDLFGVDTQSVPLAWGEEFFDAAPPPVGAWQSLAKNPSALPVGQSRMRHLRYRDAFIVRGQTQSNENPTGWENGIFSLNYDRIIKTIKPKPDIEEPLDIQILLGVIWKQYKIRVEAFIANVPATSEGTILYWNRSWCSGHADGIAHATKDKEDIGVYRCPISREPIITLERFLIEISDHETGETKVEQVSVNDLVTSKGIPRSILYPVSANWLVTYQQSNGNIIHQIMTRDGAVIWNRSWSPDRISDVEIAARIERIMAEAPLSPETKAQMREAIGSLRTPWNNISLDGAPVPANDVGRAG